MATTRKTSSSAKKKVSKKKKAPQRKTASKKTSTSKKTTKKAKKKSASRKPKTQEEIRRVEAELIYDDSDYEDELTEESFDDSFDTEANEDIFETSPEDSLNDILKDLENQKEELTAKEAASKALAPTDPVAQYLAQVRKYPMLTKEQEREIAVKYHETRDPYLAEVLVTANLRFVVKVALEYARFGAKLIDLIQEGNVGLMHAVKEFNPYKDVRLISYAVWWIRGYIQEHLMRQYSMVRIGTTAAQRKLFYQLQKQKEELDRLGEEAGIKQLSSRLGVSEKDVKMMTERMSGRDISLDAPLSEDDGSRRIDYQSTPEDFSVEEALENYEELTLLEEKIEELKPSLNERELILLEERLLADSPLTLQEIGDKYGITREAVRQAEARLLKKLKDSMTEVIPD